MTFVLDVDGVVWLAGKAIPGAPEAIERLRSAGKRVVLVSNNSGPTLGRYLDLLADAGIEVGADEVTTSAQAAASLVEPGTRVGFVGGPGVREALDARGAEVVDLTARPDVVVVGRTVDLDYDEMAAAATAVREGARFVATNADPTYPTGDGLVPGAGALVAFVATAAGRQPEVAGKPHQPVADLVRARYGPPAVMVGDRADTDGAFARMAGARFVLVLSGSTKQSDLPVDPAPALVAPDLSAAVDQLLAGGVP